jgi:hypothetical protein
MTDESHDELQALWQSQSRDEAAISLDQIRMKSRHLERIVARRNLIEYVAAAIVVAAYGRMMWVEPSVTIRVSAGLVIAAAIFVAYQLHKRGAAMSLPADLASRSALEFHRMQLERQRDLGQGVWSWYLLPFVPGMLMLQIGQALAQPARISQIVARAVLFVALLVGVHVLNSRAAAGIQQRLDRLKDNT